jgi:hypothetical protein
MSSASRAWSSRDTVPLARTPSTTTSDVSAVSGKKLAGQSDDGQLDALTVQERAHVGRIGERRDEDAPFGAELAPGQCARHSTYRFAAQTLVCGDSEQESGRAVSGRIGVARRVPVAYSERLRELGSRSTISIVASRRGFASFAGFLVAQASEASARRLANAS